MRSSGKRRRRSRLRFRSADSNRRATNICPHHHYRRQFQRQRQGQGDQTNLCPRHRLRRRAKATARRQSTAKTRARTRAITRARTRARPGPCHSSPAREKRQPCRRKCGQRSRYIEMPLGGALRRKSHRRTQKTNRTSKTSLQMRMPQAGKRLKRRRSAGGGLLAVGASWGLPARSATQQPQMLSLRRGRTQRPQMLSLQRGRRLQSLQPLHFQAPWSTSNWLSE
mmetsp:Transcript_87466/g.160314  ORF Transcript_87466/g.160314 Transcript_87466/m.160314 type:complete len:225 (-) Transcript_87466:1137-1811(-)